MSGEMRTTEPHNRLTRLCEAMTDALDAHPERGSEKCVVFLQDGDQGGLILHGYDDDVDAMADLLLHIRAIFRSHGKEMFILPMGGDMP
jgi:hypothetical protein